MEQDFFERTGTYKCFVQNAPSHSATWPCPFVTIGRLQQCLYFRTLRCGSLDRISGYILVYWLNRLVQYTTLHICQMSTSNQPPLKSTRPVTYGLMLIAKIVPQYEQCGKYHRNCHGSLTCALREIRANMWCLGLHTFKPATPTSVAQTHLKALYDVHHTRLEEKPDVALFSLIHC